MASVHPSRAALVPKDSAGYSSERYRRSPSPRRRRSPSPRRSRSRENDRTNRASPEYDDYKRPLPPQESQAPWRQEGSKNRASNYGGGGTDFMEGRRAKRDETVVNIWPPSPKAPARDLSPKRGKSSKKSKRPRSESSDSSEEEYRRRKERKEKKRAKKDKERKRSKKHYDSDSDDSDDRSRRDIISNRKSRSPARDIPASRSPSPVGGDDEDEWVVKPITSAATALPFANGGPSPPNPSSQLVADHDGVSDADDEVGPQPLYKQTTSKRIDERSYGGSLLRGEGSAMAAFLQDGTESRIPRRGEIGLTSDEIAKYEDVGYVMSGSRHRRMNAVRMRKENQVISAEEKRGILKLQKEERERREAILREEFSELVSERLKGTESRSKN
ncbi:ras-induced vulval development antagonist-domain-containing protein [Mycena albidolilacea]|uniref:Ras-induced vulval development antagonist-domain-containing protein n=1 Tax=Mycena albidolilacea TaxID=1033008 RepID=A0AAD7A4P2_9AGAR|nr:ras-induced vulval development antagonist-domain-containing protein [Mycena albidolilacea]